MSGVEFQNEDKKQDAVDVKTPLTPDIRYPTPESGGPKGPEPTRFGDWEIKGKCVDF